MKTLLTLIFLCSAIVVANEKQPLISFDGKWSSLQLQSADRIVFQMASLDDKQSVVLSIVHLQDEGTEKPFVIDCENPLPGGKISYLSGGATIGYAKGNFELVNHLYLVKFDDGVDQIKIPKESFQNVPEYFRYVLPFPLSRTP